MAAASDGSAVRREDGDTWDCSLCNFKGRSSKQYEQHVNGKAHRGRLQASLKPKTSSDADADAKTPSPGAAAQGARTRRVAAWSRVLAARIRLERPVLVGYHLQVLLNLHAAGFPFAGEITPAMRRLHERGDKDGKAKLWAKDPDLRSTLSAASLTLLKSEVVSSMLGPETCSELTALLLVEAANTFEPPSQRTSVAGTTFVRAVVTLGSVGLFEDLLLDCSSWNGVLQLVEDMYSGWIASHRAQVTAKSLFPPRSTRRGSAPGRVESHFGRDRAADGRGSDASGARLSGQPGFLPSVNATADNRDFAPLLPVTVPTIVDSGLHSKSPFHSTSQAAGGQSGVSSCPLKYDATALIGHSPHSRKVSTAQRLEADIALGAPSAFVDCMAPRVESSLDGGVTLASDGDDVVGGFDDVHDDFTF